MQINRLFGMVICFVLIMSTTSCKKDPILGCTDPTSLNYNPQATQDDGNCLFPKDLFVGTYSTNLTCNNELLNQIFGAGATDLMIEELPGSKTAVRLNLGGTGQFGIEPIEAEVVNGKVNFTRTLQDIEIDVTMDGNPETIRVRITGDITSISNGQRLEGILNFNISTIVFGIAIPVVQDDCNLVANRK